MCPRYNRRSFLTRLERCLLAQLVERETVSLDIVHLIPILIVQLDFLFTALIQGNVILCFLGKGNELSIIACPSYDSSEAHTYSIVIKLVSQKFCYPRAL